MKRIVYRYRISKYKHFTNGLLFAIISIIALIICIADISDNAASRTEMILPFTIAIISMLLGFVTMFHHTEPPKQKI